MEFRSPRTPGSPIALLVGFPYNVGWSYRTVQTAKVSNMSQPFLISAIVTSVLAALLVIPSASASLDAVPTTPIPEPVATAIVEAREAGKLVFLDFYAEWCGPCKILEAKVIPEPGVQQALEGFIFLRVDIDEHPAARERFDVVGMPTLLVLNTKGEELFRQVGLIDPRDLAENLGEISRTGRK